MPSAKDTDSPVEAASETPNLFPTPPGAGSGAHNTVFQRMLDRVEAEKDSGFLVLACVAYYNYKLEKRKWITDWIAQNNDRPLPKDVEYFVSTWNDFRIDGAFAQARQDIENFVETIVDAAKDDLSGEVYQQLFRNLSDQIKDHTRSSETRAQSTANLITQRTKKHPIAAFFNYVMVSVVANFIWFALTIVILVGLYAQFDFAKVIERSKGLFTQQSGAAGATNPVASPSSQSPQGIGSEKQP